MAHPLVRSALLALAALALTTPALAVGAPAAPPAEEDDQPTGRILSHAPSYVRMEPVHAAVHADYRVRGMLQVGLALDAPHSRTRRVIDERDLWLRDAYAEAMLIYTTRMYRWGEIPDIEAISSLLQAETDRLVGAGQAQVVLDTVIIHSN